MIFGVDFGLGPKSSFFLLVAGGYATVLAHCLPPLSLLILSILLLSLLILFFINYYSGQLLVPAEGFGQPCPHIFMTINVE